MCLFMKETPQRLRSFAPPTRDKIIIWSAVIAGCEIMALLGRTAAIYRFGADEFTGNILFAVFFVLSIGLYLGFQSVIDDLLSKILFSFQRKSTVLVAETSEGEHITIETPADQEIMEYPEEDIQTDVLESDVEFDDDYQQDNITVCEYGEFAKQTDDDAILNAYLDSL